MLAFTSHNVCIFIMEAYQIQILFPRLIFKATSNFLSAALMKWINNTFRNKIMKNYSKLQFFGNGMLRWATLFIYNAQIHLFTWWYSSLTTFNIPLMKKYVVHVKTSRKWNWRIHVKFILVTWMLIKILLRIHQNIGNNKLFDYE